MHIKTALIMAGIWLFSTATAHGSDRLFLFSALHSPAGTTEVSSSEQKRLIGSVTDSSQFEKDYELLITAWDGIIQFFDGIDEIEQLHGNSPLLAPDIENRLVNEWATFLRYRKVLLRIAKRYSDEAPMQKALTFGPSPYQKKVLLAYSASLFLFSSAVKLVHMFETPKNLFWKKFDERNEAMGIPRGELSSLWRVVTSISAIRKMAEARKAYFKAYPEAEELYQAGESSLHSLHNHVLSQIEYISDNGPSIWRNKLLQLWQTITSGIHKPYYRIFSAISIWVGDTKYVRKEPAVTSENMEDMITMLKPGDILLERENWYLSNAFLPGFWPHGIVYTGTSEELIELGLDNDPRVSRHLSAFSEADHEGHRFRLIEAISEGVVMNTIEHATDADYICAFRPNVPIDVKKEAIARAFAYVGSPYDFDFDFVSADKLVCTELVYRTYGDAIRFDIEEVAGRPVVQGTGIINKFSRELVTPNAQLDFVFFLDCNRKTRKTWFSTKLELIKSNSRNGLAFLNDRSSGEDSDE